MGFIDLIRELRTDAPDLKKAAKATKYLGWLCLFAGVWNFILPQVAPFKETDFHFPASYPYAALIGFTIVGALFLFSARGIPEMEPWGKRAGQAAIILLLAEMFLFFALVMPGFMQFPATDPTFRIIACVFFAIAMAQFVVPAYFGFRYLGRLPTKDEPYGTADYDQEHVTRAISERMNERATSQHPEMTYKDSPFPFGIMVTFPLLIAVPLLLMFVAQKYAGPEALGVLFPIVFLFIFVGPTIFNYLSSPFEVNRRLVASFTGGGSIFLFNGSWPFFRLMVYDDALEVRVMFHRFLIPFDKMDDIPSKVGFFTSGILIKSDLPEVPSRIRYSGFGMKKVVQVVNEARGAFVAASQMPKGQKTL